MLQKPMNHNEEVIIGNLIQCEYGATIVKETEFQKNRNDDLICPWHHQIDDNNMVKSKQVTSFKKKRKKSAQKDNKKKKIAIPSNSNLYQRCKLICNRRTKEFPDSKANNITYRNKATKSTGVLSYSNPSWRFITDTSYSYIERDHPKDIPKYFSFVPRSKSSNITKSKSQLLDPAVFLDEKIASAYKISKTYQPDKSRIAVIKNIREMNETYSDLTKRLVSRTVLQCIDNQSEEEEEKIVRKSAKKYCTKKPKTFQNNQDKHSEFELQEKEKLPVIKHIKEVKDGLINNKKDLYQSSLSLPKIRATSRLPTLKGPNKVYNSSIMRQREVTKQLIEGHTLSSSSYLPSLTFGHYKEKFYVPVRVESTEKKLAVKLPPIDPPNLPENLARDFSHSITKINLI